MGDKHCSQPYFYELKTSYWNWSLTISWAYKGFLFTVAVLTSCEETEAVGASLQDLSRCWRVILPLQKLTSSFSCSNSYNIGLSKIMNIWLFAFSSPCLCLCVCLSVPPSIPPLLLSLTICVCVCVFLPSLHYKTFIFAHVLTHHFSEFSCSCIIVFQRYKDILRYLSNMFKFHEFGN